MDGCTLDGHNAMTIARWPLASGAKNFSSESTDWTFTKFHRSVPEIEVENFSSLLLKNQACGALQVLKRL